MNDKKYVITLVSVLLIITALSSYISNYLHSLDIPYRGVDVLRQYQMDKLSESNDIEVIVVGDSSSGHAINAEYLGELLGMKTVSLSLTGTFGFTGIYNMTRHAIATQPNLKGVIMVNTLDIWYRKFSEEGYYGTLSNLFPVDFEEVLGSGQKLNSFRYQFNPKEMYWFLRYKLKGIVHSGDIIDDYFIQKANRIDSRDDKPKLDENIRLFELVNAEKIKMLSFIGMLCQENSLTCIYLHGPIHDAVYNNSKDIISSIDESIRDSKGVKVIEKGFIYPEEKLDTADHINIEFKNESTEDYFNVIKEYLIK